MSNRNDFGAFVLGFIAGGIAGAVVALLYAPQSGEDTRREIREKAIDLQERASDTMEDALADAERATNEALRRAELVYNDAKARVEAVANRKRVPLEDSKPKLTETKSKKVVKPATKPS